MKHILIVDDDLDIHRLLKIHFKGLDYRLHFAFDNETALIHLEHEDIAFIFLDIVIGNNETSHKVLKKSGRRPIFLMSSYLTDAYCQRVLEKNVTILDCLPKPFTKDEILNLLEKYKEFEYGGTKFDSSKDTHTVKGKGEDIGDESFDIKGFDEGGDERQVVQGAKEDLNDETQVVSGKKNNKDGKQVVKGAKENLTDTSEVVSGEKDSQESKQIVKGLGDSLTDNSKYVLSGGEDDQSSSQLVRGEKEDLADDIKHIAGKKEEEGKERKKIIKGSKEDLTEEVTLVTGEEEESTLGNIENQLEESIGDELTIISGKGLSSDEKELLRIKHISDLEALKDEGPLARSDAGYTRLMLAVFLEDMKEAKLALEAGEKVDTLCRGGYSALHFAVVKDLPEIVEFLISKGAKLTVKDNDGREPLYFAIFKERFNIVKMLVEAGAPLNRRVKGRTYLMIAVAKRNEVIFKYLLSKGISLQTRDSNGFNVNYYLKKYKLEYYLPVGSET
ncbi:ankyrin repeat domain-containing protein [Halobacteriovorax sp.]|uniref:ankyrin repeat domain-containing protein n=1 Tax=Halobacteriovorax sp. TaxID=2020862 RepID=UPI003569B0C9